MLPRKEQSRALLRILVTFGLWQTLEEWSKLLLPYMQWGLKPKMNMFKIGILNTAGNGCILVGTFVVGHMLDSIGVRHTAVFVTVVSSLYYLALSQVKTFNLFLFAQLLRMAFHFPQVTESYVGNIIDNDDEKVRTRSLMRLAIPLGAALVGGPWLAVRSFGLVGFNLHYSQALVGVIMLVAMTPLVLVLLPEPSTRALGSSKKMLPSPRHYWEMLRSPVLRWSLCLKLLVDGPYQAYDQLSRQYLVVHFVSSPSDMSHVFIVIGVSTLLTNLFLISYLQKRFSAQRLLELALGILTISYLALSRVNSYYHLIIFMPIQVVGVAIAYAELTAQVLGAVERADIGKVSGLNQSATLLAGTLVPAIAGYVVNRYEFSIICYVSAGISVLAIVLVNRCGSYLNEQRFLPFSSAES